VDSGEKPVMRAVAVSEFAAEPRLMTLAKPEPRAGEVLVRLVAAAVNPFDWTIAQGLVAARAPHVFPLILGVDGAGIVERVGEGVERLVLGDHVYGVFLHSPYGKGTYAEYITVPEHALIARAPRTVPLSQAAAAPTAGMSALALMRLAAPARGQTVLIVGATGGIGSFALQLAAGLGAKVLATSRPDSVARLRALGAYACVDYIDRGVSEQLTRLAPEGVDVLLDLASDAGDFAANLRFLRAGGRAVSTRYGADATTLDSSGIELVNLDLTGTHGSLALLEELTGLIDDGSLRIDVRREISLEDAAAVFGPGGDQARRGKTLIGIGS
jgi:NADPH:quinone reductase-like Zn-dependent oxidoreductase